MKARKKVIAIIDDDEPLRWLLKSILKDHTVFAFRDGSELMSWVSSGNFPDLIISDINMPNLDGRATLEALKRSSAFSDIPVIILSGLECSNMKEHCYELGAHAYVNKPFDPLELSLSVKDVLDSKSLQTA